MIGRARLGNYWRGVTGASWRRASRIGRPDVLDPFGGIAHGNYV